MIFNKDVFIVVLDGFPIGICEDESHIWDMAYNHTCGTSKPLLDDDVDRVWYEKINVNRWVVCKNCSTAIEDKYTGKSFSHPHGWLSTKEICCMLNEVDIERERAEAKLRAMAL